jgi:hypothetical protein
MTAFPRDELDEMVRRWLEANESCEKLGDWRPLAEFYTVDATCGYYNGPDEEFMAVGRDAIRDGAFGAEMFGMEGWSYPYQKLLVDERAGEVVGFWKQIAPASRPDGSRYVVPCIGGSWFRYAGDWQWSWQRDFFDFGAAAGVFMEIFTAGVPTDGMRRRVERAGAPQAGHYRHGESPIEIW